MPVEKAIPQLPSGNLKETEAFYKTIGFKTNVLLEEYGFLSLSRGEVEVHFWKTPTIEKAHELGSQSSCYIKVKNIASLFQDYVEINIRFRYPLTRQPWGMNEFQIDDPYGNAIKFGEKVD